MSRPKPPANLPTDPGARDIAVWIAERAEEDPGLLIAREMTESDHRVYLMDEDGRTYVVTVRRIASETTKGEIPDIFEDVEEPPKP